MFVVWDTLSGEKKTGPLEFAVAERERDALCGEAKGFYVFPEEEDVKKPAPPITEKTGAGNGELLLF